MRGNVGCAGGSAAAATTTHSHSHWHGECPLEHGYFQCVDGSTCVAPADQCDGRAQCRDASDETPHCRDKCPPDCGGGGGVCQRTPLGARCRPCAVGLRLDPRDNRTCIGRSGGRSVGWGCSGVFSASRCYRTDIILKITLSNGQYSRIRHRSM